MLRPVFTFALIFSSMFRRQWLICFGAFTVPVFFYSTRSDRFFFEIEKISSNHTTQPHNINCVDLQRGYFVSFARNILKLACSVGFRWNNNDYSTLVADGI